MHRARRNHFWRLAILLFVANTLFSYLLNSWGNRWIAILAGVGVVIMALIELYVPLPDGVIRFQAENSNAVIPKGTHLQGPEDGHCTFVTLRSARIRWYTRFWCWLMNRPLPRSFKVPVKRVDN